MTDTPPATMPDEAVVERVARAMRPNLFRLYPHGASNIHEETRNMARAAIAALQSSGVVGALWECREVLAEADRRIAWESEGFGNSFAERVEAALAKACPEGVVK